MLYVLSHRPDTPLGHPRACCPHSRSSQEHYPFPNMAYCAQINLTPHPLRLPAADCVGPSAHPAQNPMLALDQSTFSRRVGAVAGGDGGRMGSSARTSMLDARLHIINHGAAAMRPVPWNAAQCGACSVRVNGEVRLIGTCPTGDFHIATATATEHTAWGGEEVPRDCARVNRPGSLPCVCCVLLEASCPTHQLRCIWQNALNRPAAPSSRHPAPSTGARRSAPGPPAPSPSPLTLAPGP